MFSSNTTFIGIDPTAGEKPIIYAAIDHTRHLLALGAGPLHPDRMLDPNLHPLTGHIQLHPLHQLLHALLLEQLLVKLCTGT